MSPFSKQEFLKQELKIQFCLTTILQINVSLTFQRIIQRIAYVFETKLIEKLINMKCSRCRCLLKPLLCAVVAGGLNLGLALCAAPTRTSAQYQLTSINTKVSYIISN